MGFFSNLARKLIDEPDEQAVQIIDKELTKPRRITDQPRPVTTELPQPRRIDTATLSAVPPPPAALPNPPTRVAIPADLGPPPGQHEYDLGQMEDAMRGQFDARFPVSPAVPMPNRLEPVASPDIAPPVPAQPLPPPNRVMVGETYAGMNPTERAESRLRVLQNAPKMSKVKDTGTGYEVLPPAKLSRWGAMKQGFKQLAPAGARYGLGGLAGAGFMGLMQGLISPGSVQNQGREMAIADAEGQLARAQTLESQGLQNDARRIANAQNVAELGMMGTEQDLKMSQEQRIEWQQGLAHIGDLQKAQTLLDPKSQQYADAQKAIEQEAERLTKRTGRKVQVIPGNPNLNQLPRLQVDGQIVQQQYDGSWSPVYGSPKSDEDDENADLRATYEWQTKNTENEAKRSAALQEAAALESAAQDHQRKVAAIAAEISALDAQMAPMSKRDPALGPLQRQRQQKKEQQAAEQKKMDDAYEKANEKKAEGVKYPTLPPPPKRARRASKTAGNVSLSRSAWEASHPGGDWNAAAAEAARRQIPIIP